MDPQATFVDDQAAAAAETVRRHAELAGATRVPEIPDPLVPVLKRLVAAAEPGCPHLLAGRVGWRTTAKVLVYGYVTCTSPECVVRWEAWAIANGLLRSGLPQCDMCGQQAETFPLAITTEADALTAYIGACSACIDELDRLTSPPE